MDASQAKVFVLGHVRVRPTDVADAKARLAQEDGAISVKTFAISRADEIVGPLDVAIPLWQEDPTPSLVRFSRHITVQLATYKAAWDLIHSGVMLCAGSVQTRDFYMPWTTVRPGSGGHSASESLEALVASFPEQLLRPSWLEHRTTLQDGDLYLHALNAAGLHPGIEDALRQAVLAFNAGLYVPSVAMLDAASEGAWIETGEALATKPPVDNGAKKLSTLLADSRVAMRSKAASICDYYEQRKDMQKAAGVAPGLLRDTLQWSGLVRDARNVLHWNVNVPIPNDYATVSTYLFAALNHIKRLHVVRAA